MQDDPLLTTPRERSDITVTASNVKSDQGKIVRDEITSSKEVSGLQKDADIQSNSAGKSNDKPVTVAAQNRNYTTARTNSDQYISVNFASGRVTDYPVSKAGLNFRQVNLSNQQKNELNQLKEKLETMFNSKAKQ